MNRTVLAAALAASTIAAAAPALADPPDWAPAHGWRAHHAEGRRSYYTDNNIRYWRGDGGRYYCRRPDGTTGLLIGGVAGALVGRSLDNRGDRATGTILGAAGGALIGHSIARNSARCR